MVTTPRRWPSDASGLSLPVPSPTLKNLSMKRLTKYEIACMIEGLPGNTPWGFNSMCTVYCDGLTRLELVDRYNNLVDSRGLALEHIK